MHSDLHLGNFYRLNKCGRTGTVAEVSRLAVRAPIFECDDEVLIEQRGKGFDLAVLVPVRNLEFEGSNFGRVRWFLRSGTYERQHGEAQNGHQKSFFGHIRQIVHAPAVTCKVPLVTPCATLSAGCPLARASMLEGWITPPLVAMEPSEPTRSPDSASSGSSTIRIGTAGWSYKDWEGIFFP